MKVIVETTGDVQYVDPQTGDVHRSHRPSVVAWGLFAERKLGEGKIRVLARDLPDEASDVEFAKDLKDAGGDVELTVAAYAASFGPAEGDDPLKGETRAKRGKK